MIIIRSNNEFRFKIIATYYFIPVGVKMPENETQPVKEDKEANDNANSPSTKVEVDTEVVDMDAEIENEPEFIE